MTCKHARQKLYRGELSCCVCGVKLPPQPWMTDGGIHPNNVFPLVWTADEDADAVKTDGYARQTITWQAPTASWLGSELSPLVPGEPCAECDAEVLTEKEQLAMRIDAAMTAAYDASHPAPKPDEGDD